MYKPIENSTKNSQEQVKVTTHAPYNNKTTMYQNRNPNSKKSNNYI